MKKWLLGIVCLAGVAALSTCKLLEDGPTAQVCDNTSASGPACTDCDPTNPAHLACPPATPDTVQSIFNASCTWCHNLKKPDPNFPDDPLDGGEGWSNTYSDQNDIDNALALSLWDPETLQPIEAEAPLISYARLVNAPTFQLPEVAPTLRVDPGNVDNSYLYQKVASDTPKDHDPMPPPLGGLDDADICIIRTWIEAGAKVAAMDGETDYSACQ